MSNTVQYTDMKDSGIKWMGSVPASWRLRSLKYIFSITKRIAGELGHTVLSVTQRGIKPKDMTERGQFALDYSKYQLVHIGDFVMNHMDLLTGWVDISQYEGVTSPDYRVFTNSNPDQYISEYYKHIFQLCYSNRIFYGLGRGVAGFGRWRLPADMFLNFILPVPPTNEQVAIAKFLTDKCSSIDDLVEEAKSSLVDYKAWRDSIIHEAVTKGLNRSAKMKSSNIEWIGDIPSHWDCCKQKYVIQLINGRAYKDSEFEENGKYRILRVGNLLSNSKWYTSSLELEEDKYCQEGDLLYAWSMSYGPIIWSGEKVIYHYHIWKTKLQESIDTKFAYYYFVALSNNIRAEAHATTMGFVTMQSMNNSYIAYPGIDEQREIAAYLDEQCKRIEELIAEKQALIADLETYKKSLVYETVTGKRKVV